MSSIVLERLTSYIKRRELSSSLELLETYNISGKTALVYISWLQSLMNGGIGV